MPLINGGSSVRSSRREQTVQFPDETSVMKLFVTYPEFAVTITERNTAVSNGNLMLLTTAKGALIATDLYWEWSLYLSNSTLYGLNRIHINGTINWIYNSDRSIATTVSFLAISDDGRAVSCFVDVDGPLEVQVFNKSNLIVLRGLTLPDEIPVYLMPGPTPLDASRQLAKTLNKKQSSDKFILYGLHVCPNNRFKSVLDSVNNLNILIEDLRKNNIRIDSHCLHQSIALFLNHQLTEVDINQIYKIKDVLNKYDVKLITHLSPMLLERNDELQILLQREFLLLRDNETNYVGRYSNENVIYPDWTIDRTHDIVQRYLEKYVKDLGMKAVVLKDAYPKSEIETYKEEHFKIFDYIPKELQLLMTNRTVPINLFSQSSSDKHFKLRTKFSKQFYKFVQTKISVIILNGMSEECQNLTWNFFKVIVERGIASATLGEFPQPMYICGRVEDLVDLDDELFIRWYSVAVVWPNIITTPEILPGGKLLTVTASNYVVKNLKLRSSLATYQHTVLAKYHEMNYPVFAPASIYYPNDLQLRKKWEQFFWGESLLIGVITSPNTYQISLWLPGKYPWRYLSNGKDIGPSINSTILITVLLPQTIILIRPGHIIPMIKSMSDKKVTKTDITLIANPMCEKDCFAFGQIYYGNIPGEFLSIKLSNHTITISNILKVKTHACILGKKTQSSVIKDVETLNLTRFSVDIDFCELTQDVVIKNLINATTLE